MKKDYLKSIDKDVLNFVEDVLHERDPLPVTVGFLTEKQLEIIKEQISRDKSIDPAPRCTMDSDTLRHIIKRHGENGQADHSMANIEDIARMPYVLANFDSVSFDGHYSKRYKCADGTPAPHKKIKKRINGTYYIIEAVTDAKAGKTHIVSAWID